MAFFHETGWLKIGWTIANSLQVLAFVRVQEMHFKHVGGHRAEIEAKARRLCGMEEPGPTEFQKSAKEQAVSDLDELGKDYNLPQERITHLTTLIQNTGGK